MSNIYSIISIIKQGVLDSFYIWREELKNVSKDGGVIIFFFVVPLIYPVLYVFIYNNEVVRDVKMVVVDNSDSYLSREFIRKVDATSDVSIVGICTDMSEAKKMLDEKKAYAILSFPSDFSTDIHAGKQATLSLYSDMSSLLFYKAFLLSTTEVSMDMAKELQVIRNPASSDELQQIAVTPIPYESVTMFNSQSGFASFLVPAILILIIQQTLILGIGMLGGTAREHNRYNSLVPISKHFNGTLRIVFGKGLAYFLLYTVVCIWALVIVPELFSLPQIGLPSTMLAFLIPYLFACIFFSMTLSGFMTTREAPILVFVFTSLIFLFLSGISWPKESIPAFWTIIGKFVPTTPGIQGFVRINSMGATLSEVSNEYRLLWIQTGVYFILTCLIYRFQIIRSRKLTIKQFQAMKKTSKKHNK